MKGPPTAFQAEDRGVRLSLLAPIHKGNDMLIFANSLLFTCLLFGIAFILSQIIGKYHVNKLEQNKR